LTLYTKRYSASLAAESMLNFAIISNGRLR